MIHRCGPDRDFPVAHRVAGTLPLKRSLGSFIFGESNFSRVGLEDG